MKLVSNVIVKLYFIFLNWKIKLRVTNLLWPLLEKVNLL